MSSVVFISGDSSKEVNLKDINSVQDVASNMKEVMKKELHQEEINHPEIDEGYHDLEILKRVCDQIIKDHTISKDWTAIDELFKDIPAKHLEGFLEEIDHPEKTVYQRAFIPGWDD